MTPTKHTKTTAVIIQGQPALKELARDVTYQEPPRKARAMIKEAFNHHPAVDQEIKINWRAVNWKDLTNLLEKG